MNLLLIDGAEIVGDAVMLADARAQHLRTVLKVSVGDTVRIGRIDGPVGLGTVRAVSADGVELACAFEPAPPPQPRVDILLALPRPKVMRRLWAQLAALGVGQVILTNAEKVERDYFDSHVLEPAGYRPLLLEGLQQAKDTRVPVVSVHKRFKVLLEDDLDGLCPSTRRLVAHPGAEASLLDAASGLGPDQRVLVAIGPEGGWNDFELGLLDAHGFIRAGLGPRTLTTTTACVAVLTMVHEGLRRG